MIADFIVLTCKSSCRLPHFNKPLLALMAWYVSRFYVTVGRTSVRLSVCSIIRLPHAAAMGLLLNGRWAGNIDLCPALSSTAAKCGQCHVCMKPADHRCKNVQVKIQKRKKRDKN